MSIKVMSWVWENVNLKASHKLVLLALSDNANDEGVCWPSITTIARKCGLSDRYIQNILTDLRDEGYLYISYRKDGDKNQTNLYTVRWGGIVHQGGEPGFTRGGEVDITRVVNQGSPKSSINHHIEPLINAPAVRTQTTEAEYKDRIVAAIARGTNKDGDIKQHLIDLFHITPNWNTKGNKLFLQWAKRIPPDQTLEQFARWWYSPTNWRSKGHSPPSLAQIMELWLQAFVEKKDDEVFAAEW